MGDMRQGVQKAERDLQKTLDDTIRDAQRAKFSQEPVGAEGKDGDIRMQRKREPRPARR